MIRVLWLSILLRSCRKFLGDFSNSPVPYSMARNTAATVYIGNLDEKVTERVLYEILIQVGHVVDLHIPRDRETNRQKGYAFAEYESEEIANYAVRLFSGLVRLRNKTLKFAISGQDKSSQNSATPVNLQPNKLPQSNGSNQHPVHVHDVDTKRSILSAHSRAEHVHEQDTKQSKRSAQSRVDNRVSPGTYSGTYSPSPLSDQATSDRMLVNNGLSNSSFEYNRRVYGAMFNNVSRPTIRQPISYPSY